MTLEQIQEKMAKLVQDAYELGLKEGSGGVITISNKARPLDVTEVYSYMLSQYPQLPKDVSHRISSKWFDYYSANGWKVGKNQMKDWRAAVRNWDKSKELAEASKQYVSHQPQRHINR